LLEIIQNHEVQGSISRENVVHLKAEAFISELWYILSYAVRVYVHLSLQPEFMVRRSSDGVRRQDRVQIWVLPTELTGDEDMEMNLSE
jgi:hypothetical protein